MRTKLFILILLGSIGIFQFCKVDDGKPDIEAKKYEPVVIPNLITNSSFENAGAIDKSGWEPATLNVVSSLNTAPPSSSGNYCIQLFPDSTNQYNYASTTITGLSGFIEFQLSFYAKTANCSGFVDIKIKRNTLTIRKISDYNFSFEKWTERILQKDTCTFYSSDTIEVAFWANKYSTDSLSSLYIDMVKFCKLN